MLRAALLWLLAFSGAFVFIEPGPYEVIGLATLFFFIVTGLSLRPALAPLLLLLVLLNVGYAISYVQVIGKPDTLIWLLVSIFLSATAILFAAMLGTNTERRLQWLLRGYIAAAVVVSLIAIGGYFRLFGGLSDLFVIFGRAKRHVQGPERVRRIPGPAGPVAVPAHADRATVAGARRRVAAARADGWPAAVVLARRLGPVRAERAGADGR